MVKKVKTSKGQKAPVPKIKRSKVKRSKDHSKGQKVPRSVKRSIGQKVKRSIGQKLNRSIGQKVINLDIEKYKRHFSHETVW